MPFISGSKIEIGRDGLKYLVTQPTLNLKERARQITEYAEKCGGIISLWRIAVDFEMTVKDALACVPMIEGAKIEWINHLEHLILKRTNLNIA